MKRTTLRGAIVVLALVYTFVGQHVAVSQAPSPGPGLLAYNRQAVIPAPDVDFARVADLDDDGDPDILAVESEKEDITWWENVSGDGMDFEEHVVTAQSYKVTVVSPGDIDADGDIDFLALAPEHNRLSIWTNGGNGDFTPQSNADLRILGITYVEAANVNDDDFADFFGINDSTGDIFWWENDGQAAAIGFKRYTVTRNSAGVGAVSRLDAVDVNRDGLIDFVAANLAGGRISWWQHSVDTEGNHVFQDATGIPSGYREPAARDVTGFDADGDSDIDMFALRGGTDAGYTYRVLLWENQGDETFVRLNESQGDNPGNRMWPSLDSGDINGDGAVDFVTAEKGGRLCWYENPNVPTSPTPTVTQTSTLTPTATQTNTPIPTAVQTPTHTPIITSTPTVTATPTMDLPLRVYLSVILRSP